MVKLSLLETHQKLTIIGVILLVVTFLINYYHQEDHPGVGLNYAYVTGIVMLAVFSFSFIMFTKDRLKDS
ncbi:MAG: phage holin family protein [Nitrosopumilus sp.]|nr:phage holin family protein [Nitrosopumilus sp.]